MGTTKIKQPRIRRKGKQRGLRALVLVPELARLRDEGKISAAECAVWSSLIQSYDLMKSLKFSMSGTNGYAILRTKRHWRLFRMRKDGERSPVVPPVRVRESSSDRALLIMIDASTGRLQFKVCGPGLNTISAPTGQPNCFYGSEKRYSLSCKSCGWHVDNVRRLERVKRHHLEHCPTAELEIGPYVPLALVHRSPGYSFRGGKMPSQSRRVSRNKHASVSKPSAIDRPLNRRRGPSIPDFYPDDN